MLLPSRPSPARTAAPWLCALVASLSLSWPGRAPAQVSQCDGRTDGTLCDDGSSCTFADQCVAGACVGVSVADGVGCIDSDVCTVNERCLGGRCVGTPTDAASCRMPDAGQDAARDVASGGDGPTTAQPTDAARDGGAGGAATTDAPDAPLSTDTSDAARDGSSAPGDATPIDATADGVGDAASRQDGASGDDASTDGQLKPPGGSVDARGTASSAKYRPEGGACACAAPGGAPMTTSALFFVVGAGLMALVLGRFTAVPVRARRRPRG